MTHRSRLIALITVTAILGPVSASAQVTPFPGTASTTPVLLAPEAALPDSIAVLASVPLEKKPNAALTLRANVQERMLYVMQGDSVVRMYPVAVGKDDYPTPSGSFKIRKIVWNPSWRPPDSEWAKKKTAKGPGDPDNPMKVVKIFFKDPDYYLHGTDAVETLGSAASHGCLRMAPDEVAELAKMIMEHGGEPREENWFMRLLHFRRDEKVVYLKNPIAIQVIG